MLRLQPRNKFIQHIETTLKIDWENYFNTIFFSKWFSHWEIICEVLELYWYLVLVIMLVLQVGLSVCLIPTVTWPVTGSVSQPHVVTCWRLFVYNLFVCLFVYLSMCICLYVTIIIILKIIIIFKIFINIILSQNCLQKLSAMSTHAHMYELVLIENGPKISEWNISLFFFLKPFQSHCSWMGNTFWPIAQREMAFDSY